MIYDNLLGQVFLMEITGDRSYEFFNNVGLLNVCIGAGRGGCKSKASWALCQQQVGCWGHVRWQPSRKDQSLCR